METLESLLITARESVLEYLESRIQYSDIKGVSDSEAREILVELLINVEKVGEIQTLHRSVLRLLYGQEIEQIEESVVQYQAVNAMLTTLGKHSRETIREMALSIYEETACPFMAALALVA